MEELLKPIVDLITAVESNEPQIHKSNQKIERFKKKHLLVLPIHLAVYLLGHVLHGSLLEPK
jgi:hypothetical protein